MFTGAAAMTLDVHTDLFDDDLDAMTTPPPQVWAECGHGVQARLPGPRRRKNPRATRDFSGGSDRRRSGDLSIFSRTLYQLSRSQKRTALTIRLATLTGLEPATSAVTGRHANQLRYRAKQLLFGEPSQRL